MKVANTIRRVLAGWREADPYHYECTVCDRSFQEERSTCPDCGGDVERAAGGFESTVDPTP